MRMDGWKDRHDKDKSGISQFANAPKNAAPLHKAIQDCILLGSDPDVSDKYPLQTTHIIDVDLQQLDSASFTPDLPKYFNRFGELFSRVRGKKPKLQYASWCSNYEAANIIITASQPGIVRRLHQPQVSVM
jgi:hypothetical protein